MTSITEDPYTFHCVEGDVSYRLLVGEEPGDVRHIEPLLEAACEENELPYKGPCGTAVTCKSSVDVRGMGRPAYMSIQAEDSSGALSEPSNEVVLEE